MAAIQAETKFSRNKPIIFSTVSLTCGFDTNILGVKSLGSADPVWHAHAVQDMNTDGHPDIIWRKFVSALYSSTTHGDLDAATRFL